MLGVLSFTLGYLGPLLGPTGLALTRRATARFGGRPSRADAALLQGARVLCWLGTGFGVLLALVALTP